MSINCQAKSHGYIRENKARKGKRGVGVRLRAARKQLRMNQTTLAAELGCSQGFVSDVEIGRSAPSALLVAGLERLGFSGYWLMTGEGEMRLAADRICEGPGKNGYDEVPLVGEMAAGLRLPIPEDKVEGTVLVPRGGHAGCECFAVKVTGRNMEPTFRPDDIIVIDKTCLPQDNDIAVVAMNGHVLLKRVSVAENNVFLLSLNGKEPPVLVSRHNGGARVAGKVIQLVRTRFS